MSNYFKKVARNIGMRTMIDRLGMLEDQNINMQIALAATGTYFGRMPRQLTETLDGILKKAQEDKSTQLKTLLDQVVVATKAYMSTETTLPTDDVASEAEVAPAAQLDRNQVLGGKAGEVISVERTYE